MSERKTGNSITFPRSFKAGEVLSFGGEYLDPKMEEKQKRAADAIKLGVRRAQCFQAQKTGSLAWTGHRSSIVGHPTQSNNGQISENTLFRAKL